MTKPFSKVLGFDIISLLKPEKHLSLGLCANSFENLGLSLGTSVRGRGQGDMRYLNVGLFPGAEIMIRVFVQHYENCEVVKKFVLENCVQSGKKDFTDFWEPVGV